MGSRALYAEPVSLARGGTGRVAPGGGLLVGGSNSQALSLLTAPSGTLRSNGSSWEFAAGGKVIQSVLGLTNTQIFLSTYNTWTPTTLQAQITPKLANSQILCIVRQNGVGRFGTGVSWSSFRLMLNGVQTGTFFGYGLGYVSTANAGLGCGTCGHTALITPGSAGLQTFSTQIQAYNGQGTVCAQWGNVYSSLLLFEISPNA